jgi:dTDP-4-amino-4,6-dideoxygalactose transaminase
LPGVQQSAGVMNQPALTALEDRLSGELGYAHAVLFGRARSALAALIEIMDPGPTFEILIPTNVCTALLTAVSWSNARVRLVPIDRTTGLVPDARLAEAIRNAPGRGLAIATQLYGFRQQHPTTIAVARERGWYVVENDTLLTGAKSVGNGLSPFADAMLASFGYTKTLDVGGGGAILMNDPALAAELRYCASNYPMLDEGAENAELAAMLERRKLLAQANANERLQRRVPRESAALKFGFPARLANPLNDRFAQIAEIAARRRERAARWYSSLQPLGDALLQIGLDQPLPWRLIRRAPLARDAIVSALREAGFDAGTNYPPLFDEFPAELSCFKHDDASAWGAQVINLWVTDNYDDPRIDAAASVMAHVLERLH